MNTTLVGATVFAALALTGSAKAAAPPMPATDSTGYDAVSPHPAVPLHVERAGVEHRRLAVSVNCGEDGVVRVRGVGRARFDCADGKGVARIRLDGRLPAGKLRIDARAGSMTVTRTLRPTAARARVATLTFNINGGTQSYPTGCTKYLRLLRVNSGWASWYGTTLACGSQLYAGDYLAGTQDDYWYLSTAGTWVLYRIRQCPVGSSYCSWVYIRPGF